MTPKATQKLEQRITRIAQEHLDIETLETRNGDSLDFRDLSVWEIKAALMAAYEAGRQAGLGDAQKTVARTSKTSDSTAQQTA